MGWNETKEALDFGLDMIHAGFEAKANDGKFDLIDLPLLMGPLMKLPAAIEGAGKVPQELAPGEFSPEEQEEMKAMVLSRLANVPGIAEKWVRVVKACLMISQGLYEGFSALKE